MAVVTWNPADKSVNIDLSESNLRGTGNTGATAGVRATESKAADKWYWEIKYVVFNSSREHGYGIATSAHTLTAYPGAIIGLTAGYGYYEDGRKINNLAYTVYGDSFTTNDIIGVAIDLNAGKIWFAKNNVWQASGDPAAGTNPAFTGLSGTYFPFIALDYLASAKARFAAADFTYSPPSGFSSLEVGAPEVATKHLDGKILLYRTSTTNIFDGRAVVDILADAKKLDGKVTVKNAATKLFSGKVEVAGLSTKQFDGKAEVTGLVADLLDGKVVIEDLGTDLFNGKLHIVRDTSKLLDGKLEIEHVPTDYLDGKVIVEGFESVNIFDGKIEIQKEFINLLDEELPFFEMEAFTGGVADIELPFFDLEAEASIGSTASASAKLPMLDLTALTGAKGSFSLPLLGCDSGATVGATALSDVELPMLQLNASALMHIVASLESSLSMLNVSAGSKCGIVATGDITLHSLHLVAEGAAGRLAIGSLELPSLIVEAELSHVPIGSGDMELPSLSLLAKSVTLFDPSSGCSILRYDRWR